MGCTFQEGRRDWARWGRVGLWPTGPISAARPRREVNALLRDVDAGQPEAGGVELGRGGEVAGVGPQSLEPLGACPFDDAADEGGAAVVGGLTQLEAEQLAYVTVP